MYVCHTPSVTCLLLQPIPGVLSLLSPARACSPWRKLRWSGQPGLPPLLRLGSSPGMTVRSGSPSLRVSQRRQRLACLLRYAARGPFARRKPYPFVPLELLGQFPPQFFFYPGSLCNLECIMATAVANCWPFGRWGVAAVLASYIGFGGLKKKSLSKSGAIAVSFEKMRRNRRWPKLVL